MITTPEREEYNALRKIAWDEYVTGLDGANADIQLAFYEGFAAATAEAGTEIERLRASIHRISEARS